MGCLLATVKITLRNQFPFSRIVHGAVGTLVTCLTWIDKVALHWPEEDIGNLRVALNALVRLFRL